VGRLRRVGLWCGAAAIGLLAILLLVVNLYVQSQGAQARIQQELSRRLGTPIRIRSVSVTPWGGLTLSGITIPQVSTVTTSDFLQARSFHLHVRILPLFSRRLIIREVSLLGPNVVWAQTAEGKWRLPGAAESNEMEAAPDLTPQPGLSPGVPPTAAEPNVSPARRTPSPPPPSDQTDSEPIFVPELRRLNVTDGNFRFLNQSGASVAVFDGVRFHSSVRNGDALRGTVAIAKVSVRDRFFLENVQSPLHYDPQELNLPNISAHAAGGDLSGHFTVQPQAPDSPFSAQVSFRNVQAEQLVTEARGPKGVIQGKLEGNFEANGRSADTAALTGQGDIVLRDGQLQQYSLLVALGQILQIEELTQLQLQQAEAKYHVDPGVVTIDQLVLRSPNIRVTSTGTITFNGRLRLQSQLAINDKVRGQLFSPIRDNFQPINEPGYSAVEFEVNGTIDRPKTNLVDRVVGRNLKDFVNGLLGGGKSDRSKRKRSQDSAHDASPEPTAPTLTPTAAGSPP
jgi:uncharacterized protein involved in outer membrane biogenesis